MIHNLHVNNVTGQEIAFDLLEVLESSPLFTPHPLSREIWNMGQLISLRVAESLVFHPYNDDLICKAMDALSVEASYLYRCEVIFEWIPEKYELWVTLRQTPPDERTFLFGSYFQKSNQKEPIEWQVLEREDGNVLLLSKYALHTSGYWLGNPWEAYADGGKHIIWENSDFRKWLNGEFCTMAFSEAQRRELRTSAVVTCDAPAEDAPAPGDRVFLLSKEQIMRCLPTSQDRITKPTAFAAFGGAQVGDGNCAWWMLPHQDEHGHGIYPQAVLPNGVIQYHSRNVAHRDWCVRPAIRISEETLATLPVGKPAAEKTTREFRLPLDGQSVYFLRFFWESGEWNRISIDKELANDSHYLLSAQAAKQLEAALQWGFETLDLVALLRRFFKTESDYTLTKLMSKNGISYQAFHY